MGLCNVLSQLEQIFPVPSVGWDYPNKTGVCNGLIFRVRKSWFRNNSGEYEYRIKFTPLLRKSCPGCPKCGAIYDAANEMPESILFPLEPKDKSMYQLCITNVHTDWETGYTDDFDVEFVEYVE